MNFGFFKIELVLKTDEGKLVGNAKIKPCEQRKLMKSSITEKLLGISSNSSNLLPGRSCPIIAVRLSFSSPTKFYCFLFIKST